MTKPEKFCVLVLDDDICFTTIVSKALRAAMPSAEVLVARSVAEAQLLLSEYSINFYLLDMQLPDGTGMDFLCDLRTLFPDVPAMLITGNPTPELAEQAKELGVVAFLQKPVKPHEIATFVRKTYEHLGHATALLGKDGEFAVSLTCLSALDIIQLKCLSNASLVLQVTSPKGVGQIFFEDGQIIHAETDHSQSEAAFEEILRWKGGRIKEMPAATNPPRTIDTGWQGLLLNVAQRIDESSVSATL